MDRAAALAQRLREGIWELEDFAFQLPRADKLGQVTREECNHFADLLSTMSILVRNFNPDAGEDDADADIIDMEPYTGQASDESGGA